MMPLSRTVSPIAAVVNRPTRSSRAGRGRAEDTDGRRAHRSADVHHTGIVGHQQIAKRQQRSGAGAFAAAGRVGHRTAIAIDKLADQRTFRRLAGEDHEKIGPRARIRSASVSRTSPGRGG